MPHARADSMSDGVRLPLSRCREPDAHGPSAMRSDLASRLIAWAMGVPMLLLAVWALLDLVSGTR